VNAYHRHYIKERLSGQHFLSFLTLTQRRKM
jgi:hypothetical protein